jgi:SAM-dependent methyltransferase
VLADLGATDGAHALLAVPDAEVAPAPLVAPLVDPACEAAHVLLAFTGQPPEPQLALWRDALWPRWHAVASYRLRGGELSRRSLQGRATLARCAAPDAQWLVFRERLAVMSQASTVAKFDQNAKGWDGEPGTPGYAHHRWMRRFVACYARIERAERVLDFGSGAGWCGIEAARRYGASELCAFDPSPQLVEIARRNAQASGIRSFRAEPGFGEAPPFARPGEPLFDLVISSGVISFVPRPEPWLDRLAACVKPGGRLVIGDIHPGSYGFRRRRRRKVLLPVRELNGQTPADVRRALEQRGLRFCRASGYQLTWPVPQAMDVSERRLGGALHRPLLWANQAGAALARSAGAACQLAFDSWVMELELPAGSQ